jgi:hypothetical protein
VRIKETHIHLAQVVIWTIALWPTFTIWKDSLTWIAFVSIYALIDTSWGNYVSAKAVEAAKANTDQPGEHDR